MHKQVLYFSVWPEHQKEFADMAEKEAKKYDFQIVEDESFSCASDLLLYLDGHHDILRRLYVIVDYLPFLSDDFNYEIEAEAIGRAILGYPEVYFLFDESLVRKYNSGIDYSLFLFAKNHSLSKGLVRRHHLFDAKDTSNAFAALTSQKSNLFDGTNLRYCLKCYLYDAVLNVERHNFERIQSSRRDNLALCVEEERTQNRFNSYSLFANGFRVWPIMTATELKDYNEHFVQDNSSLKVIFRDFDLQFPDANPENNDLKIENAKKDENLIDYIRGAKYWDKKESWSALEEDCNLNEDCHNHFWNKLTRIPRHFISKGIDHVDLITSERKYLNERCNSNGTIENNIKYGLFSNNVGHQYLRGMYKPITGIYYSFQCFDIIRKRYNESVRWDGFEEKVKKIERKQKKRNILKQTKDLNNDEIELQKKYYILTARKEHHHGVPLDIYDLTKGMIDRARKYQDNGKFVISAIVAQEVIEILNGFHESLMLKAYHIYAVSENAICMNLLGGNELWLQKDAYFRVNKIEHDLKRMLARPNENDDRKSLHANIVNQIFSNCRQFCKQKEHFTSEAIFISAMGRWNEGYEIIDIYYEICVIVKKIIKEWQSFKEIIWKWNNEKK